MAGLRDESVMAARAVALWIARGLGLTLTMIGFVGVGDRLIYGAMLQRDITTAWRVVDPSTGMGNGFMTGVPLMICGLTLLVFGRPIARWAIRPPEQGCAGCGYATHSATGPAGETCPECGRRVG